MTRCSNKNAAFSLTEILVAIGIIAALATLLFPLSSSMKARAKQTYCLQNQRSLFQGLNLFAVDNNNLYIWTTVPPDSGNNWHRNIWPYLRENGSYGNWGSADFSSAVKKMYVCPSNPSKTAIISYALNSRLRDKKSGAIPGKTILLLDYEGSLSEGSVSSLNAGLKGWHSGLNTVTFADGHAEMRTRTNIPDRTTRPEIWDATSN